MGSERLEIHLQATIMWLTGLSSSLKAFKHVSSKICCQVWPLYLQGAGIPGVGNMCHRAHKTDHSQVCKAESKRCWGLCCCMKERVSKLVRAVPIAGVVESISRQSAQT
jgi:hypothetical protein